VFRSRFVIQQETNFEEERKSEPHLVSHFRAEKQMHLGSPQRSSSLLNESLWQDRNISPRRDIFVSVYSSSYERSKNKCKISVHGLIF
jgi:hypothetical protein